MTYFFRRCVKQALDIAQLDQLSRVIKMEFDRKKEIINICLDLFVEKGLSKTSTRDISKALQLQNAALYYYFKTKTDAVVACFDVALSRLEIDLLIPTYMDLDDPKRLFDKLLTRAKEMAPVARFILEAWTSVQYRDLLTSSMNRMLKRMEQYTKRVAKKHSCSVDEIRPYVNLGISAVLEYMVFGDVFPIDLHIEIISKKVEGLNGKE